MTEKHTCKFKLIKYKSGNRSFFCTLPDCNKKINPALALGKRCICWRCGNEFLLTEYALRLVKPHCENCHKSKIQIRGTNEIIIHPSQRNEFIGESEALSLSERLEQTLKQAQEKEEEI